MGQKIIKINLFDLKNSSFSCIFLHLFPKKIKKTALQKSPLCASQKKFGKLCCNYKKKSDICVCFIVISDKE